ncbi:sugar transferase [Chitinophaga vietnamensis]|uniref:sugar transferase n=1 Tax=Chitinophaga vietnamensis TaxID=2593957 RepID=UPI001F1E50D3|nr:sugar transferase [Chitinophaga vietnamensis]
METITPGFTTAATLKPVAIKNDSAVIRQLGPEKIVIFVGNSYVDVKDAPGHYKYLVVPDIHAAQSAISEVLSIFRKIPAVIIYRFNSNYELECTQWEHYFRDNQIMRSIPFLLYAEQVSEELRAFAKKHRFIDEVITRDCLTQTLDSKISFISKYKYLSHFTRQETLATPVKEKAGKAFSHFMKRTLDIAAAGSLLLLLSPVLLLIALLIRLESKGPIFYAAKRAGKNYRIFKFYKFRTMVADADKQLQKLSHLNQYNNNEGGAVFYKVSNDPRITKLGAILRNTSLDEIPQLWNVIIGDMSLVGNRPLPLYEAAALTTDDWAQRFNAPAGITGLWQISKRGTKDMSVEERIGLDISYANRHSFAYDMWIMMNTPFALVQKENV